MTASEQQTGERPIEKAGKPREPSGAVETLRVGEAGSAIVYIPLHLHRSGGRWELYSDALPYLQDRQRLPSYIAWSLLHLKEGSKQE